MTIILTIIAFIIIFSILVLVHELGHFVMAKRAGIRVEEFGFGLPPKIWGKKKGETVYSINWIPFGGFVRMYGEDGRDPKMLRSSRSFSAKPMRARVKVVIAGVVMNLFLAWILIWVGFTFGMQPLLSVDDVFDAVNDGTIVLEEGLKIKNVIDGGLAGRMGIMAEDIIFSVNGEMVDEFNIEDISGILEVSGTSYASGTSEASGVSGASETSGRIYKGVRGGQLITFGLKQEQIDSFLKDEKNADIGFGVEFYDYASFPRVKIFNLEKYTADYKAGLRAGDTILSVNGEQIYNVLQLEELIRGVTTLEYEIYRDGVKENFVVEHDQARRVIISSIFPDSPAETAGLKDGDIILSVNGKEIDDSLKLIEFVKEHKNEKLAYLIDRAGQRIFFEIKPDEGRIGVYLSELISYGADRGISLYNSDILSSVVEIKNEKYAWYAAPFKAFKETFRLAGVTVDMFMGFIGDLVSEGEVPETIAGPVGIAQMTHTFVQEGIIPLIRFMAILSLSLAVINILPFPALDGGRLLFLFVEFVIGRRINQRWESYIHAFGFFLILGLILAVTYNDVARLVRGV